MKRARFLDHWRHVYEKNYPNRIERFALDSIPGLGSGHIDFKGGIHAICGQNGSGKSTLMNCIRALISTPHDRLPKEFLTKITSGTLTASLCINNTSSTISLDMASGLETHVQAFTDLINIDLPRQVPMILNWIRTTENFHELLESLEPHTCTNSERAIYSFVVGRKYDEIKIFELEEINDLGIIPHFELFSHGIRYDSSHMGLGEFSIFYLVWLMNRLNKMSLVLIEEPESFITPRSQKALVNYFAKMSDENKLWILISTHSEHILENIPIKNVSIVAPSHSPNVIYDAGSESGYFDLLGLNARKRGLLLFEDNCGIAFAKLILAHFGSAILKAFDFLRIAGDTKILTLLSYIEPLRGAYGLSLHLAGILDGDKRATLNTNMCNGWPIIYLPSDYPPDKLLFDHAINFLPKLSSCTSRSETDLRTIISQLEGLDHHDAILELARAIGISYEQIFFTLFQVWISEEVNNRQAREFVNDMERGLA